MLFKLTVREISIILTGLAATGCGAMWASIGANSSQITQVSQLCQQSSTSQVFRSVGPSNTSVLACGGSDGSGCANNEGNLTISGSIATFASGVPSNVGIGDVIVYDSSDNGVLGAGDSVAFISCRVSSTAFTVQSVSGGTAPIYGPAAVWRIYRAYTSIANALTGNHSENTSIIAINNTLGWFDASFNSNNNLVTSTTQWVIALYADAADTTPINAGGWTTSATDYLKIYVPYLSTDVGTTQRHSGLWDSTKANMTFGNSFNPVGISYDVWIDGLQVQITSTTATNSCAIALYNSTVSIQKVSNSLVIATSAGNSGNSGICLGGNAVTARAYAWNNLVIGFNDPGGGSSGLTLVSPGTAYVYNNTLINNTQGLVSNAGNGATTVVAKNNIIQGGTTNYEVLNGGTFGAASTNNVSSDNTAPGSNALKTANPVFVNPGGSDYRLSPSDSIALDAGVTLSSDANLPFSNDVSALSRPQGSAWDIGASEAVPASGNATEMLILSFGNTATTFTATATFNGDNNANNSAEVYYCDNTAAPGCSPLGGSSGAMIRSAGQFNYTAVGLVTGHVYTVDVVATDSDGISGATLTGSVTP